MRLALSKAHAGGLALLSVAALSACGGSADSSSGGSSSAAAGAAGRVVDVYSSLPMQGPSAADGTALSNGIKLAIAQAHGKAGPFKVHYTPLDDSAGASGWDASQTAANARKAAADPQAVYYVGEFNDGASEISMPILNEAGIAQVSPANTYVGLTTSQAGSISDEPQRYSPTGTRTYLRIVPIDSVQGAADLLAMRQAGCTKVALASDKEPYGTTLAKLIELQKSYYGVDIVSDTSVNPNAPSFRAYANMLKGLGADCLMLAGVASKGEVDLTKEVHAVMPAAKFFAPDQMCARAWTNPKAGGVPAAVDPLIECTEVTHNMTSYPGGQAFLAAYKAKYSISNPNPYAILGYEAMKLGLSTIAGLGPNGDSKSAVLSALFSTSNRHSVLGTYGFDKYGDTTLKSFGLYKVGKNGDPVFVKTITPSHVL